VETLESTGGYPWLDSFSSVVFIKELNLKEKHLVQNYVSFFHERKEISLLKQNPPFPFTTKSPDLNHGHSGQ
jgi:hypothetical protein